jgi:hypothetical protein
MHCWEFHHSIRGRKIEWHWRALNADGTVHSKSQVPLKSSVDAFEDARKHGFDKELHEWYVAHGSEQPCVNKKRLA